MMNRKIVWFLCFCLLVTTVAFGQGRQSEELYKAEKLFEIGNYKDALQSYQQAMSKGENSAYVKYKAGRCYLEAPVFVERLKALPLLIEAKASKDDKLPAELHLFLGDAYHLEGNAFEALKCYDQYEKLVKNDSKKVQTAKERIATSHLAQTLMNQAKKVTIRPVSNGANTEHTEYNPIVAADESLMAYTVLRPANSQSASQYEEKIMIMTKQGLDWSAPKALELATKYNAGTAGLSADGQRMIVYLSGGSEGSLYTIDRKGDKWGAPAEIKGDVNSRYQETTASITPDGKMLYFASNRPGGYGGMDIYVSQKQQNGLWGRAVNLGAEVNTAADEDAPFIHPDGKTLYFTSNGKGSIGGKDIFRSFKVGGKWQKPENVGYPINTTANDNYFTLIADGSRAYFSSDRPGGKGGQDIYTFDMPEEDRNIPLTLIKGRILAGEDEKPVKTVIKVVDNETGNKVDYVYSPDPETGNYLIIFPPGKNYDMIVQAEGYLPYAININIPNQTYFYELYQQVILRPIKQFDVVVGQEVEVKNAFYDTGQPMHHDLKKVKESIMVKEDSVDVFDLMETIISAGDAEAYDYLLELMFAINPIENVDFSDKNKKNVQSAEAVYYYEENDKTKLEAKKVGNEIIYTLPTFHVTEEALKQKDQKVVSNYDKKILEPTYKVYFASGDMKLGEKDKQTLQSIIAKFKDNPDLGVEISGYASNDGNAEYNKKLSNERAISVLDFLNKNGVARRRIVAKGYGATAGKEGNAQESRRVELRIIDLNAAQR